MKNYVVAIAIFFALAINLAHAEEDFGPIALTMETTGGMVPPEREGWGHNLTVYKSGKVVESYRSNFEAPWVHTILADLSSTVMSNLLEKTAALEPGTLVFDEDQAECTDRPVTGYYGINQHGVKVEFASYVACRDGYHQKLFLRNGHNFLDNNAYCSIKNQ